MKISNKEMDNSIFYVKPQNSPVTSKKTQLFCFFGVHDYLDDDGNPCKDKDDENVLAKITVVNNKEKYWILRGIHGKAYNPIGLYSEKQRKKIVHGREEWTFRETNKEAFDDYLNFLRTKNKGYLLNCERKSI